MLLKFMLHKAKLNNFMIHLFICIIIYVILQCYFNKNRAVEYVPKHLHKYLIVQEKYAQNSSACSLRVLLAKSEKMNSEREMLNWNKYGPVDVDTTIVVIRTHTDAERLRYLIVSLAQVRYIDSVLLIFSHSYYDEQINHLIRSIDFCMVLQIFFPNSIQLFPGSFPGLDPGDCTNITSDENRCCVDRDARATELKHHWWWTAHVVFEELAWTKSHKGMVVFLDEASYVLPDLLHMVRYTQKSLAYIPEAEVISFGRSLAKNLDYNQLTVDEWKPPYDKGLAFNKTTWRKIVAMSMYFCEYDDASWSYSLLHLFGKFPRGGVVMVASTAPRVVSTGVFHSGRHALENIWWIIRSGLLYPERVKAVMMFSRQGMLVRERRAPPRGNGGWSDRDRLLCFDPLMLTVADDSSTTTSPIFTIQTETHS